MSILDFAKDILYDMKYAIDEGDSSSRENLGMGEVCYMPPTDMSDYRY